MRGLLFHADGRPRRWFQQAVHCVRSTPALQKIARRMLFTREGQVRSVFGRVYALLKITEAAIYAATADDAAHSSKCTPAVSQRCKPKLTVVAMARNESARAHDIMRHFCALFDRIVLIDHLSEDDTARIALSYNGYADTEVIVLRGEDQGYYQSEYMTACANALIREAATDWIFFIDFDEFLPFQEASSFRQALVDLAHWPVIHMHWHNIALRHLDPPTLQGAEGIIGASVSEYKKIALNARAIGFQHVTVAQGNHSMTFSGDDTIHAGAHAFGLFHIPILGFQALKAKLTQGVRAMQETASKDPKLGYHWKELAKEIEKLDKNPNLMREIALRYSLPLQEVMADVVAEKYTEGTRRIVLGFAQCEPAHVLEGPQPAVKTFTLDTITQTLASCFPPLSVNQAPNQLPAPLYPSLPSRSAPYCSIEQALLAAAMETEIGTSSASDGHIPFIFILLEIFRPRRYVELGAHKGVSFFAACQHIRENGKYGEAIAVGQWQEHPQASEHEYSFETFKSTLDAKFSGTGKFIRGDVSAASAFAEQSVDILYVKEPHTFEDLKEIYAAWRGKLTDNGVLILHNTNEYKSNFGGWQFFNNIRDDAWASFQFYHDQGIGILAFGTPQNNPAITLLKHFAERPENSECYFSYLRKKLYTAS